MAAPEEHSISLWKQHICNVTGAISYTMRWKMCGQYDDTFTVKNLRVVAFTFTVQSMVGNKGYI